MDSSATNYLNGTIDEVTIYNRSLSSSEINIIYLATKTQYFKPLILQNLTTTSQKIVENLKKGDVETFINSLTMINCSERKGEMFFPYFCINSFPIDAVKTFDWDTNCQFIE